MFTKIILAVSFFPIWPVMYFITLNNLKPKKNIILGTTLPHNIHENADVLAVGASFKKWLNIVMLPLLPLFVPFLFFSSYGNMMLWATTWLTILIIAPQAVFAVHRGRLLALKRENGWGSQTAGQAMAEIKIAGIPVYKINDLWFLPPFLVSLVPLVYALVSDDEWSQGLIWMCVTFAATTALFWLFYHIIYHLRAEVVNENVSLTMALTRVRRYNWGKFWIISAWLTGALNLGMWLLGNNELGFLAVILVYTLAIIIVSLQTEFAARTAQQKLTASNAGDAYLDEDDKWLWGLFYYNPHDRHFFVNDRVGMNMSINLGTTLGKLAMIFSVACLVALPFLGAWLRVEERTPPHLAISSTELTAIHTRTLYVIDLENIDSVTILNTLPAMSRTNGTGLPTLLKGHFSVSGYGASLVCLDPQSPPFLVIQAEGKTYVLNDVDNQVTQKIYENLTAANTP
jgi:uncharacterized membrane protein